jgi:hypothetical protein
MTKNCNKLTNNHSTFLFIVVVLLIFALTTSIVAIILAVKNKKTETFKLKQNNSETPSGTIISYGGISVLDGYLSCDGKDYKSSDYPELFKVIGTTFGSGDASKSTDFNVPNLINGYLRGDTKSSLSEDQNNYLVKSENIEPLKLNIPDGNVYYVITSKNGKKDWSIVDGDFMCPPGGMACGDFIFTNVEVPLVVNLQDVVKIGTGNTPIDNRPSSITTRFLIKI